MSMMLREPLETITPLRDMMNRLFEESFVRPERLEVSAARALPLDISESDDQQQYILEANVAGFKPEEIQITSSGDTITIHAAKKEEAKTEKAGYVRRERYMGEISRTVTLPSHIDADKIQATCEQGVLTLRIPKAEGAKTKQIPIKAKGH
jgi:HSP20 family protein